ncbi:MAG: type II toxin-antitoxin system VapC family toxin [Candidatus Solibacter sp.]|nr:type II toxin-antitoxin system VapC family toxin [Candidatus Solibacter sp.]
MNPRFLLDTHVVVRWLYEPKKLSREQRVVIEDAERRGESVGVSAMSLLEIALLNEGRKRLSVRLDQVFHELDTNPALRIIPITTGVAYEVAALGDSLRDPGDRVIVATARVHRLRLLTADQRIIESRLVPVIE